jgi:hypothetical protein
MSEQLNKKILKYIEETVENFQDKSLLYGLSPHERYLFKLGIEVMEDLAIEAQIKNAGLFTGILSKPTDESN